MIEKYGHPSIPWSEFWTEKPDKQEAGMHEATTISISIARDWREVYDAIWRPEFFPRWASGLANADLKKDGERWRVQGPDGPITIRFTGQNAYGVMDHYVELGNGGTVYIPLRVFQNDAGAEVALTLFRQPDMSPDKFEADAQWVRRDLAALQRLFDR
jgi:hypothetical protein